MSNTMMMTVVEVDFDPDIFRNPAIEGYEKSGQEVYFVRGQEIVGVGITVGGTDDRVEVLPHDETAKAFFAKDKIMEVLGRHGGFSYSAHTGNPFLRFSDEDEDRYHETYIVSKWRHDNGSLPKRFTVKPTNEYSRTQYMSRIDRKYPW